MLEFNEEEDKFFKCIICMKILSNPRECTTCRTAFCNDCIEGWQKEKDKCPLQCAKAKYVDMHRVLKAQLMLRKFKCPIEECDVEPEGYPY